VSEFLPYRTHNTPLIGGQSHPIRAYWEDLRFPATVVRTNPAQEHPALQLDPVGRLFRHTNTDTVYLIAQMPHSWREGTVLIPHVHWAKTTSASGGVYWQLSYKWAEIGKVISNAVVIGNSIAAVSDNNIANTHALTRIGEIDSSGKKISDMLLMQLSRVHNNSADTYGASALLMEFDIHYQVSSPGSRREFVK
jgi:hypothetical protein